MAEQYVSPEEMENRRQNMINSCQRVANVLMECATQFQEYAALVPHPNGGATLVDFPASLASLAASATNGGVPASKEKKPRKKREKKDPDAPKRPPSAYLLFQNEKMQQLRDENKDMPYREVLKLVAEKWKLLDDVEKKVYVEAYSHANENFKGVDAEYKRNKEGALAIAAAAAHPIEESEVSSDAESDDELESDDSSAASPVAPPTPPPAMTPAKAVKPRKNAATPAVATPTVDSSAKKDKKRKNKDIDPALLAPTPMTEEKKKKKKTKE